MAGSSSKIIDFLRHNILTILNILGVIGGVVVAVVLRASRDEKWTAREVMYVGFVGELFLRILKSLILPLIMSSMISAVGSLDLSLSGRIGTRAIVYYMTTTVSAVILGIILVLSIHPGDSGAASTMTKDTRAIRKVTTADMLMDLIRNLFPPNLVQAATKQYKTILIEPEANYENRTQLYTQTMVSALPNGTSLNLTEEMNATLFALGQVNVTTLINNVTTDLYKWKMTSGYEDATNILGLVVFSTVLGVTLGKMGPKGKPLLNFFVSMSEAVMQITSLVVWLSPIGVLFLVASKMLEMDSWEQMAGQLGKYFITVMIGLFIHGFIVLQLIYFVITRKLPFRYVANLSEALTTAFATSSSSATLPVALTCLEEKNGIDPRVTRFVMPIGATINMDGTALYEAVAALFISQVRNVPLSFGKVVAVSITATAASIGAAGIPQAGIVTMVMVLDTLGLPAEDVSLILAVDWFLDRFRTFTNVLGDSLGAGIVHHLSEKELAAIPHPDSPRKREPDIEFDSPASADLEKGEPTNGMPSQKNPTNVTSASVEVEWQSTSM